MLPLTPNGKIIMQTSENIARIREGNFILTNKSSAASIRRMAA